MDCSSDDGSGGDEDDHYDDHGAVESAVIRIPGKMKGRFLLSCFPHLGPRSKKKLLQLFNVGWRTGTVPQVWR